MFHLWSGERICLGILALFAAVLAVQYQFGNTEVDWDAFIYDFVIFGLIIAAGLLMRMSGRMPLSSLTMMALGIYPVFASVLAIMCYLQFPFNRPAIDPLLLRIDTALGYDWAAGVAWLAENPGLSRILAAVYVSSLPQLTILLLVLGVLGRVSALHRMLVTGLLGGLLVFGFWAFWPSFGPSALVQIDPEVARRAGLLVTNEYGAELMRLAVEGAGRIEKHQVLGVVAFPSFHIVMALLAALFARGTWLFWPYLALNLAMIPATALHGGHHAVDLIGGAALFALAYAIACGLVPAGQVITSGVPRPVRVRMPASASTAAATPASAA
jgi:hypothetical protein